MDGLFTPARVEASPASFGGILYAEDFDDPADPPSAVEAAPPPPAITQADLDRACADAVRAARAEWQASRDQARLQALASLGSVLRDIGQTAERATLTAAEGTVTTILSMVSGLLPHFCREHGSAEVRALLGYLLPTLRSQERISIRLHPDLVSLVQADVAALEGNLSEMIDIVAAPLEQGDVKVSWENGSLTRNGQQIVQAVQDALGELGLFRPIEAPAKRSMAYAE